MMISYPYDILAWLVELILVLTIILEIVILLSMKKKLYNKKGGR